MTWEADMGELHRHLESEASRLQIDAIEAQWKAWHWHENRDGSFRDVGPYLEDLYRDARDAFDAWSIADKRLLALDRCKVLFYENRAMSRACTDSIRETTDGLREINEAIGRCRSMARDAVTT